MWPFRKIYITSILNCFMKIACKQSNICIKSNNPSFKYKFKQSGVPLEVEDSHVEKILRNKDFYLSDKEVEKNIIPKKDKVDEKSWEEELIEIKGVGKKTAHDIILIYPNKHNLLEALEKEKELPFDDDISKKLKEVFIH